MSIELIIVIVAVLLAIGNLILRRVRKGSFAPWWWRGTSDRTGQWPEAARHAITMRRPSQRRECGAINCRYLAPANYMLLRLA
jgi:hypothetical protein